MKVLILLHKILQEFYSNPWQIVWKATPRFARLKKFNPCQPSPSLAILVPLRFIVISLEFLYLSKLLFSGLLQLKFILTVAKRTQNTITELLWVNSHFSYLTVEVHVCLKLFESRQLGQTNHSCGLWKQQNTALNTWTNLFHTRLSQCEVQILMSKQA